MAELEAEVGYTSLKYPMFKKKSDWRYYKAKMLSYLMQKDCVEITEYSALVPINSQNWSADQKKDGTEKRETLLRLQNRKAVGLLLSSIDTETDHGKEAFEIVENTMNKDVGYSGGNFPDAWMGLTNRFEEKDILVVADLKQKYYEMKMKITDKPSVFIMKVDEQRKKLNEAESEDTRKIKEQDLVTDILAKLPKNEDHTQLGPYQLVKKMIEKDAEYKAGKYTLQDLKTKLKKVYKELYPDKEDDEVDSHQRRVQISSLYKAIQGQVQSVWKDQT